MGEKYFTQEEYDILKRRMFETEQQKEFRLMLNSHGYSGSWFSKHADLDPYNFYLVASKELSGLSFGDQVKKFFGFFVCEKTNKPALTDKQENQIVTDAQSKARDHRNKGNTKIIKEVCYKKRFL